jgi:hypothetical protein
LSSLDILSVGDEGDSASANELVRSVIAQC